MPRGEIKGLVQATGVVLTAGTLAPATGFRQSMTWTAETAKTVDVSAFTSDARGNQWMLQNGAGNFLQELAEITTPTATTVTVTVGIALTGTYYLVGK